MVYLSEETAIVVKEAESMTQEGVEEEDIEMNEEAVELTEAVVCTVAVEI